MHKLYIFSAIIFSISIIQCAEQCIIKSIHEQVIDLVFADHSQFSHEDLMAFGLAWRNNDKYLRATSQKRKNYFLKHMPMVEVRRNSFQWHGYGSRADRKIVVQDDFSYTTKKRLIVERLELSRVGKIHEYYGTWDNFESELFHKPTPFYNTEKQLCFIGQGWAMSPQYGLCGNILCYQVLNRSDFKDIISYYKIPEIRLRCLLQFNSEGLNQYKLLIALSDFPYLLKALLNSKQVKKEIIDKDTFKGDFLVFNLEGVTLPDNYKEYVVSTRSCSNTLLSHSLTVALDRRYQEQQKK